MSGYFITFEGIDFSGKSTQARLLADALIAQGYAVVLTREPGGTPEAEEIRTLIGKLTYKDRITRLFLMQAARAHHVQHVIAPALAEGKIVISDRFYDSSTVYQGTMDQTPVRLIGDLNGIACQGVSPDLTFFLDIYAEEAERRAQQRTQGEDIGQYDSLKRNEREELIRAYWKLVEAYPNRMTMLIAEWPVDFLHQTIRAYVKTKLAKQGITPQKGPTT